MTLESFRRSRNLTQAEAAAALGLSSAGYLSRLETGAITCPMRLALKIEAWSGGMVLAVDLLSHEDARLLERAINRATASTAA